jgi:DNA polymerase III subunit delta'
MPLLPLEGHQEQRVALVRTIRSGSLPQSLLLHGPAGIGKERFGLWLAQRLLCTEAADTEPCGLCAPCRHVTRLEHPDVHWFFPLPRPDGAAGDRLREKLEDLRAAELQAHRDDPLHLPAFERAPAHFLAAIQTIQRLASQRSALGGGQVFVIGDADAMVPQESSPEAANAFLKLLEEPPESTTFVLTTRQPGALLPTILSRVLPVRLRRLASESVVEFLVRAAAVDSDLAQRIAQRSEGSIGRALRLLPAEGGPGIVERQRSAARALLTAALASNASERYAAAHALAPSGARAELPGILEALAQWLRDLAAVAAGAEEVASDPEALPWLRSLTSDGVLQPYRLAEAQAGLLTARELAYGNVNPQLLVADLLRRLHQELVATG